MADKRDVWVTPHPDGWAVRRAGADRASRVEPRKTDAVDTATGIGRRDGVEVIIQRGDGVIQSRNTYPRSSDPRSSRG